MDNLFRAILELKTVDECYDFFEDICRWSFDISIYFGIAEFATKYEECYNIPFWLCNEKNKWDELKSDRCDDEHITMMETLIRSMNA